jgi:hypothetical protein
MKKITVPINSLNKYLKTAIIANRTAINNGYKPRAIEITGEASVGKTWTVSEVASELNIPIFRIQLATNESPFDINGNPSIVYRLEKEGNVLWCPIELVKIHLDLGYTYKEESRTIISPPAEIADAKCCDEIIILIDDWTRANNFVRAAIMELINEAIHIKWGTLPKYTHVILTSNPDDGKYSVGSVDEAEQSRMDTIEVLFTKESFCDKFLNTPDLVILKMYVLQEDPFKDILAREFINIIPVYKDYIKGTIDKETFTILCQIRLGELLSIDLLRFIDNKRIPTVKEILSAGKPQDVFKKYVDYFGDGTDIDKVQLITQFVEDIEKNYSLYVNEKEDKTYDFELLSVEQLAMLEYILFKYVPRDLLTHLNNVWFNAKTDTKMYSRLNHYIYQLESNGREYIGQKLPSEFDPKFPYLVYLTNFSIDYENN